MLHQNYNLKHHNTFGLTIIASHFLEIDGVDDYLNYLKTATITHCLILGGGSNMLFLNDFDGLIIHPAGKEIKTINEDTKNVWVEVSAAVEWDDFVAWAVANNLGGIENLSDIPGNVGASPVQNIGAYGVEAKDTIDLVNGFYLEDGRTFQMDNTNCKFGYRDSIFKQELKNKTVITSVVFKLTRFHKYHLSYGNLQEEVTKKGEISVKNVRAVVREIRVSKLPNVNEFGNAGSFFKNPVITKQQFNQIALTYPTIPGYAINDNSLKIPAAWLIDQCGLKGKKIGGAQVFTKQPLVIINTGNATGKEIYALAQCVIKSVLEKFNITIHPEVNIIS